MDVDEVKLIALVESFENAYLYDGEHTRKISFKPSRILRRYRIHVDRKAFCRKNTVISVFTQPVREGSFCAADRREGWGVEQGAWRLAVVHPKPEVGGRPFCWNV